CLQSKSFSWTF
nr:immunoglobulin light chain junction region [Macaca mulatta]